MFLSSDTFLLSTAGQDCAVLQWSMEGMVDPLTKKPENLKVVVSNSDGQSDIDFDEGGNYPSKEQSKRIRDDHELPDKLDGEEDGERTRSNRKGRFPRLDDFNNGGKSRKTKPKSNSNLGGIKEPVSEMSDQTSEEYSSEDYKQQYPERSQRKETKNLRGQRGRPSGHRRSFEEDMYQDHDSTSDEKKGMVLRGMGRTRRYEEDDVSIEEDSDDDITARNITKPKQNGYQRGKSPVKGINGRRRGREEESTSYSEEYSDGRRDRNCDRNNRYDGRRNYKNDRETIHYNRNKR